MEWEVGVGGFPRTPNSNSLLPFSNSNSELELITPTRSLFADYTMLSRVALFVSFRDPVRGFVSEGVAKAAGF